MCFQHYHCQFFNIQNSRYTAKKPVLKVTPRVLILTPRRCCERSTLFGVNETLLSVIFTPQSVLLTLYPGVNLILFPVLFWYSTPLGVNLIVLHQWVLTRYHYGVNLTPLGVKAMWRDVTKNYFHIFYYKMLEWT